MTSQTSILLTLLLVAAPASAQDDEAAPTEGDAETHAAEAPAHPRSDRARAVLREELVLLLNPMGAQHRLDLGFRRETGDPDDLLTTGSHVEGGALTAVAPVFALGGAYLQVQPLSFLVLRGELYGAGVWPIGMEGAGHFGVNGYDADVHAENLPAERAGTATGWIGSLSATLQGAIPLGEGWRLLVVSQWGLTRTVLGSEPFYYSMRHDLVLAREDFVVTGTSFVGLEARVASDLVLRFGAYDDLRNVPASGYVGHQLGPLAMIEWEHLSREVASVGIFVRGGGYTHHVVRAGEATILAGLSVDYELGGL